MFFFGTGGLGWPDAVRRGCQETRKFTGRVFWLLQERKDSLDGFLPLRLLFYSEGVGNTESYTHSHLLAPVVRQHWRGLLLWQNQRCLHCSWYRCLHSLHTVGCAYQHKAHSGDSFLPTLLKHWFFLLKSNTAFF